MIPLYRGARITAEMLESIKACPDQVAVFRATFPRGGNLTQANVHKAHAAGLDIGWLAGHLPTPALKAYEEARALAWKAYEEARALAWKAYVEATAPALKAYVEATATALWDALPEGES